MIPCANPLVQYLAHKEDFDEAISRVLKSGRYILGEETRAFEQEFAKYIGVSHGIGVGSGTEALHLALKACGVGDGDEVVTVSHTAVATVAAIELAGARPVLVDIEPEFYTIDPCKLGKAVTSRTKAVIPVHLYGQPANMDAILALQRKFGFRIIEDCAQAHGALYKGKRVGSFGDMGCFSFYPTKNLGAFGDGGMVVTSNPDLARRATSLREYGWAERYVSHDKGWNTRLDELQSAVLRLKLHHLDENNAVRQKIAMVYHERLKGINVQCPEERPGTSHAYHLFVIRCTNRDRLCRYLQDNGIGALVHYPVPVHLQPAYSERLCIGDDLVETIRAAEEIISLPLYPELQPEQLDAVISTVRGFYGK